MGTASDSKEVMTPAKGEREGRKIGLEDPLIARKLGRILGEADGKPRPNGCSTQKSCTGEKWPGSDMLTHCLGVAQ